MRGRIESLTSIAMVLALWWTAGSYSFGQEPSAGGGKAPEEKTGGPSSGPKDAGTGKVAKPADPDSLENLLARALKINPDIRVAEAKVQEAEAELNRARLLVSQKVVSLHGAIATQRDLLGIVEKRYERDLRQNKTGAVSAYEIETSRVNLSSAKAKLADLEAELAYLTGKEPLRLTQTSLDLNRAEYRVRLSAQVDDAVLSGVRYLAAKQLEESPQTVAGTQARDLRKLLNMPITLQFDDPNITLKAALSHFEDQVKGVSFLLRAKDKDMPPVGALKLKEKIPLGAALQALEDTIPGLRFTVREYGILVTLSTDTLPSGAVRLHDFWKREPGGALIKDAESTHNLPPGNVEGKVKAIEEAGLIIIDVGSDAGLDKGHTLEVFRMDPKPIYLGTVRIIEVRPKEAVGQPVRKFNETVKVGDKVANKIFVK